MPKINIKVNYPFKSPENYKVLIYLGLQIVNSLLLLLSSSS